MNSDKLRADSGGHINTLIVSLYLIDSEDDILHGCGSPPSSDCHDSGVNNGGLHNIRKRARLYQRLCKACSIANKILRSSSSAISNVGSTQSSDTRMNHRPWNSGGDGPLFGVHCDIQSDTYFNSHNDDIDGDVMWQSQQQTLSNQPHVNNSLDEIMNSALPPRQQYQPQQPHLRAICRYGNDVNDMWRCIALFLQISNVLSSTKVSSSSQSSQDESHLTCAIECWDMNDGHILLIEAAEYLPSWVDDDALQGGVGGPTGCRNRCWIVNGEVHLIPPSLTSPESMSRDSAISILMQSIKMKDRGDVKSTVASTSVQHAIRDRIDRTDYSMDPAIIKKILTNSNPHWHVTAAAVPASVAHFIQMHPTLIPMIVDSFCANAPKYQRMPNGSLLTSTNNGEETHSKTMNLLGNSFPYEQIVIIPIVFTRTNYAELVTGRGVVPSFSIPSAYRSVELNRYQRRLRQSTHEDEVGTRRFQRSIDIGIRLCAGLDWIISSTHDEEAAESAKESDLDLEDLAINTLGVVERRLRIYWTRIDAEANGRCERSDEPVDQHARLSWIEQAWAAGPNGDGIEHAQVDSTLLQALDVMSRCHVFNPELCQPLWKAPCPYTRPGLSLLQIVQLGMKNAIKWQREEFTEDLFPMPNASEIDDDVWMEVDSLEELEEEMKALSSRKVSLDSSTNAKSGRPRRKTRRSRVDQKFDSCNEDDNSFQEKDDAETLNKILTGFRTFVDGDGDLDGVVSTNVKNSTYASESNSLVLDSQNIVPDMINIDPRKFLNTLQEMLRNNRDIPKSKSNSFENDDDISKFFFHEDLDDGNGNGSDESSDEDTRLEYGSGQDEFMTQKMVSKTVYVF